MANYNAPWNKGLTKNDDVRIKNYGLKVSLKKKGRRNPLQSLRLIGRKLSEETKKKMRSSHKGMSGKKHTKETIEKIKKSCRIATLEKLKDNQYVQNRLKGLRNKPTKPEREMIKIIEKNNLPYRYVGNGDIIIEGRNPDFINTDGKKEVIEVFGNYWHSPLYNINLIKRKRESSFYDNTINHYKKYGFKCHIFWENSINERDVLQKLGR